jgi:aminoglycoside phosphotransferase (APT) family kinase protein
MTQAVESFDNAALQAYLELHVAGFKGPMTTAKFSGGQSNPTFKVSAASGDYVLRRQPLGKLLKSAHAVDREFRVIQALADTAVPVPRVYHLCEDPSVIGSLFYVMEHCEGNIYWDAAIPEVDGPTRSHIYAEVVDTLAALHQVDIDAVGLADYGKSGNYFERQLERWTAQYRASEIDRIAPMETLIAWLNLNLPSDDGRVSLVHGDYRLDNLMFSPDNRRILAILDWELSTLGHPYADVGYLCMLMRMPQIPGSISGLKGLDLDALGIPNEQAVVARYCEKTGIDSIDNIGFYIAFSFFRLAAIIQGVAKRASEGNASNKKAAAVGQYVAPMAMLALEAVANQNQTP